LWLLFLLLCNANATLDWELKRERGAGIGGKICGIFLINITITICVIKYLKFKLRAKSR